VANPRAAAQRATARAVRQHRAGRGYQSRLPASTTTRARQAPVEYARGLFANPGQASREDKKVMGRYAGYAAAKQRNPNTHSALDNDDIDTWVDIAENDPEIFYH
jgi:hypothetical protein